jgi:LCP family protein required for cell wall assembly
VSEWPGGWFREEAGASGGPGSHEPTVRSSYSPSGGSYEPTVRSSYPSRPGTGARSGSSWPDQPPSRSASGRARAAAPALPGTRRAGSGSGGRQWRFWGQPGRRGRRIALIAVIVVVALLVGTVGSYFWLNSKLNRSVALPAFTGTSAGQNWLIAGSDGRDGLTDQQIRELHVGFDFGTANSDSLMLLHIGSGRPVLVSIPRDSYVPIPGYGENKINAALGFGGPTLLVQTVENVTGLRINHYVGIGFAGLANVVNEVGGVKICLPTALQDLDSGANFKAGCQVMNGAEALAFVRDRHSFADEDLQRMQDQRAFLKALLDKATSPGVYLNPFTALPFGSSAASAISVDQGTDLKDLLSLASALRNPLTGTVPIANANYDTSNAGDAVLWNRTQALALFNALQNNQPVPPALLTGTTVG